MKLNYKYKRIISLILLVTLIISSIGLMPVEKAKAASVVGSWDISDTSTTGNSVTATLYDDGLFLISGTGKMKSLTMVDQRPYVSYLSQITHAKVEGSLYALQAGTFYGCSNLTTIDLGDVVPRIYDGFTGCINLETITGLGALTLWSGTVSTDCTKLVIPKSSLPASFNVATNTGFKTMSSDGNWLLQSSGYQAITSYLYYTSISKGSFDVTTLYTGEVDAIYVGNSSTVYIDSDYIDGYNVRHYATNKTSIDKVVVGESYSGLPSLFANTQGSLNGKYYRLWNANIGNLIFLNKSATINMPIKSSDKSIAETTIDNLTILSKVGTSFYIPINSIVYGIANSTAWAWCQSNSRAFISLTDEEQNSLYDKVPSITSQTKSFDKYTGTDISYTINTGSGTEKATDLSVSVNDSVIDGTNYSFTDTGLTFKKEYLRTLSLGQTTFDISFNNTSNTLVSGALKINISDSTPKVLPSVTAVNPTYDRTAPEDVCWNYTYGTEASSVVIEVNDTILGSSNYTVGTSTITLSSGYLDSLTNGTYMVNFKFNDTDSTVSTDTITVTGVIPVAPVVNIQSIKYNGNPIGYTVGYGNIATSITAVKINGLTLSSAYYTLSGDALTLSNDYLSVLSNGLYAVSLLYNDGTVIDDKLSFIVPKDTSSVNTNSSLLNVIFVNGSTQDVQIPLGSSAVSVDSLYMDSNYVDTANYSFDSSTHILTISSSFLNTAGTGTHSMLATITYSGSASVVSYSSLNSFAKSLMSFSVGESTVTLLAATPGDTGIIIASINGGTTGLTYYVDNNGNTIIDGYIGTDTNVTIPDEVDGSPVTGIEDLGSNPVDSVTIPDTVTDISDGAIGSETEIIGGNGSAAEEYANNNGNTFTNNGSGEGNNGSGENPGSGGETGSGGESGSGNGGNSGNGEENTSGPSVPAQTVKYDLNGCGDIKVTGVQLGNAESISYIVINGYKIYSDGTVENLNTSAAVQKLSFTVKKLYVGTPSAIEFSGVPFTLDENGNLKISGDLLSKIGLSKDSSYDIEIGFSDGSVISDSIDMEVVDTTNDVTEDPGSDDNGSNNGNGGSHSGSGSGSSNSGNSNNSDSENDSTEENQLNTEVGLPEGVLDKHIDYSNPVDVVIPISIDENTIPNASITIDNEEVENSNYDLSKDNLTLHSSVIENLVGGPYTVRIVIKNDQGTILNSIIVASLFGYTSNAFYEQTVYITKIMELGSKLNINRTFSGTKITFSSSNKRVATVDKNGIIVTKKEGIATITAKVTYPNNLINYKIKIIVRKNSKDDNTVNPNRIVYKDGTEKLLVNTENTTLKSSDTSIASVSDAAVVKGIKLGTTKIKVVENKDKIDLIYTVKVTVKSPYLSVTNLKNTFSVGNKYKFSVTVVDSTDHEVLWESSNPKIASVDNAGNLKALSKGKVTITVKCGKIAKKFTVTIK